MGHIKWIWISNSRCINRNLASNYGDRKMYWPYIGCNKFSCCELWTVIECVMIAFKIKNNWLQNWQNADLLIHTYMYVHRTIRFQTNQIRKIWCECHYESQMVCIQSTHVSCDDCFRFWYRASERFEENWTISWH